MQDLLTCPVCDAGLTPADAALRCPRGHSFDLARQGYVNLGTQGAPTGDDAAMVAARAEFLDAGWFDPLTEALVDAATADAPVGGALVDVGAGTGHHLTAVLDALGEDRPGVALDASVYAARRAARAHPRALAVVADAWGRLPLRDGCAALVLVVFAPRSGPEIARVLAPGGTALVAAPTDRHLAEVAQPLGLLSVAPDKERRLGRSLEPALSRVDVREVTWTTELDHGAAFALAAMGPAARHASADELRRRVAGLPEPARVTGSVRVSRWRAAT